MLQVLTSKGRCRDAQHDAANCCNDYDLDVDGDASDADVNDTRRCGFGESGFKGKAQIVNLVQGFRGFGAQLLCPMFGLSGVAWTNGSGWGVGVRLV